VLHYLFPPAYSSVYLSLRRETELHDHTEHLRQLPCDSNMCICLYTHTYVRRVYVCLFGECAKHCADCDLFLMVRNSLWFIVFFVIEVHFAWRTWLICFQIIVWTKSKEVECIRGFRTEVPAHSRENEWNGLLWRTDLCHNSLRAAVDYGQPTQLPIHKKINVRWKCGNFKSVKFRGTNCWQDIDFML
jgi:hypothetical protein